MKNIFERDKVITISIAHFLHDVYSSFFAPLLPLLIEKLSISYSLVGILTFIQRIPSLFSPFVGILADKVPLKIFVVISPVITTIAMSLLGVAPHVSVVAILLFVMGISSSLFHVPSPVMIRNISGSRIGKGMSFYMIGGEMARTLGPLIIVGAVSLWGLEGTWKLIPFGLAGSAIIFIKIRKIKPSQDVKEKSTGITKVIQKYRNLFLILAGYLFFRAFMKQSLSVLLPTFLIHIRGVDFESGGIAFTLFQFSGVAGAYFAGKYSDVIGRKSVLLTISIASPILMFLFLGAGKVLSIIIVFILGFFVIAQGPVLLAVVNDLEKERPALVNGIYMTISFIIGAVAMLLVGFISDIIGLEKTMYGAAIMACLSIFFVFFIPSADRLKT